MKIKNILVLFVIGLAIFSCKKDDDNSADYDAGGQSIIDDSVLIDYLKTHYLNEVDGGIWTITNGETPLMGQVNTQNIIYNDFPHFYGCNHNHLINFCHTGFYQIFGDRFLCSNG